MLGQLYTKYAIVFIFDILTVEIDLFHFQINAADKMILALT